MIYKATCLLVVSLIFLACDKEKESKVSGAFMNLEYTETPQLLMPNLIASPVDEYNGTFSPDGDVFFYTTNTPQKGIITYTRINEHGDWNEPLIAPFSGEFSEYDPIYSPDGDLYFTSERPASKDDRSGKTNIWLVKEEGTTWSDPILLRLDEAGAYYSSFTNKGDMYYNIWDTGDLYKASQDGNEFKSMRLDTIINTNNGEGDPFISPNEDYLIYRAYNNSLGQGDLYISFNINEKWTRPENLGAPINSDAHEMCPYVTLDGKYFIFASGRLLEEYESIASNKISTVSDKFASHDNGNLNIYYMSAEFIPEMKKKYEQQENQ